MTQKEEEFFELALTDHFAQKRKKELVTELTRSRIDMNEYVRLADDLDTRVDLLHFRYISRYRLVEQVPDRVHPDALIKHHWN